jgi:hypothetical protein
MTPLISLSRALTDPQLFGGTFGAPSFWTWRVVAKLIDGIPLSEPREVELFKQCTGRTVLPSKPVRSVILLAGRRAGKDRWLSAAAVWRAALCTDWRKHQSAGEGAVCILLGADKRQSSILRKYAEGLLQVPLLTREVTRSTGEVTEFRNGASLEIATNDARLVRGRSAIMVAGSECCYWKTTEFSASSDEEVVGAAEPSMAMCPDGGLLLLGSSVYRKRGYMFRKYKQLHGNDESEDVCWFAPSSVMNPELPAHVVDKALAEDAPKARAEFQNIWREDLSDLIPLDVIESCTDFGTHERAPQAGVKYYGYCDSSSGIGDSFAVALTHRSKNGMAVLDVLRERKPRFVPAQVIAEYAELLKAWGITEVQSDKYTVGFHEAEWRRHGIRLIACERTTSENYLHALPLLLAGRARLVDNTTLRNQLASLERRVGAGDRETVSHPAHASAHDDVACAACGALVLAAKPNYYAGMQWVTGPDLDAPPADAAQPAAPAAAESAAAAAERERAEALAAARAATHAAGREDRVHTIDLSVSPSIGPPVPAMWRNPYWR